MARHHNPRPLKDVLTGALRSHRLSGQLSHLSGLQSYWARAAPEWAPSSQLTGLRDGTATVTVTSPAAATRLRFESGRLAARLREAGLGEVREIRARIIDPAPHRSPRHRPYSPAGAARMAEEAQNITDSELRASILRLAQRLGTPPDPD
jgi:hypothetical protein